MSFNLNPKIKKIFWLAPLALLLIFGLALASLAAINYNKTISGLTIGGLRIGGVSQDNLGQFLSDQIAKFSNQKISLAYGEKTWTLAPTDFGLKINAAKTAAAALAIGRGPILAALSDQIKTLFAGRDVPLDYSLDPSKLNLTLDIFSTIETPVKNSSIKYDPQQNDFVILPAQSGATVDRGQLIADILKNFGEAPQTVSLSLVEAKPLITEKEIEQVMEGAKQIVNDAPYFLQSTSVTWRVDKAELAGWITTTPSDNEPQKVRLTLDPEQISNFLIPLAASINREPIDAQLTTVNGELKFAVLSQDGAKLNIEASAQKITADILTGKNNIDLITDLVAPQISNQTTQELGLLALLGTGESNFSGSPTNRRVNIKVGATKFNGFLLKPGEEFSLSQNIGDIDAQNGWVPELVIKNKQTIPEYGGGLCQVSTTLFRAAVNAGLKITERHPHAYPVHYYDPPGFDATVYPPSPDLKFINDTPGHLLLQSRIEGNKLIFDIYGTADGREVKVKGPVTTQKNPNGSLKATLTQEIWRDGQLERKQVFNSSYNSPALYPNPNAVKPTPSPAVSGSPAPSP